MTRSERSTNPNDRDTASGPGRPGVVPEDLSVGDRVDLVLSGATQTNHAKATVTDTDTVSFLPDTITVKLDRDYIGTGVLQYETTVGWINKIVGESP